MVRDKTPRANRPPSRREHFTVAATRQVRREELWSRADQPRPRDSVADSMSAADLVRHVARRFHAAINKKEQDEVYDARGVSWPALARGLTTMRW